MKRLLVVWVLGLPLTCLAGRPVYHELSLADLVAAAEVVAIVSKPQSFELRSTDALGCERVQWNLKVLRTLKSKPQGLPAIGSELRVLSNVTSVRDCTLRGGWKTDGASFAASRYTPSELKATDNSEFMVFLVANHGVWELVSDHAVDAIRRVKEIEGLLR